MSRPTLEAARAAIQQDGVEVFRTEGASIALAQRVRSHLMDSGVVVSFDEQPRLTFTVRAQSSDFPGSDGDAMFERVRSVVADLAAARGFSETERRCRQVQDPIDQRILDVWYELTFAKDFGDLVQLMEDVRWALSISKCVGY